MSKLLVCSESTKDFLSDFDEVRVVKGAPNVSILSEVGSYEKVTAIGGGAVVDTAKILSSKPIVCYPTTASGATETSWSVYWDGTDKKSLKRHMPACIIYTSGTSGNPKGVVLSHGGILANCVGALDLLDPLIKKKSPVFLTWLPLSHSYEHAVQFIQILIFFNTPLLIWNESTINRWYFECTSI